MENTLPMISNKKSLVVKGVGSLAVLGTIGFALPLIVNAFMGAMTILGIGVVVIIGGIGAKFLPLIFQITENKVLNLRVQNAQSNPIETLQNNYIKGCEKLEERKKDLIFHATETRNMETELQKTLEDFPDQDWSDTENAIKNSKLRYQEKEQETAELEIALEVAAKTIKVWARRLKLAESTQRLENIGGNSKEDVIQEILKDAATTEVSSRLNNALASTQVNRGVKEKKEAIQNNSSKKLSNNAM